MQFISLPCHCSFGRLTNWFKVAEPGRQMLVQHAVPTCLISGILAFSFSPSILNLLVRKMFITLWKLELLACQMQAKKATWGVGCTDEPERATAAGSVCECQGVRAKNSPPLSSTSVDTHRSNNGKSPSNLFLSYRAPLLCIISHYSHCFIMKMSLLRGDSMSNWKVRW